MNTTNKTEQRKKIYLPILRTVSVYALFSTLWIVVSDWIIKQLTSNPAILTQMQTYKGIAFVTLSSLLIFQLLHGELKRREKEYSLHQAEVHNLLSKLQKSNLEIKEAYDDTIKGWAQTLELRDLETHGHSERVVKFATAIGKEMNFPQDELRHLRWGALLHDIGKLGIPDRILGKQGNLDKEEREEINRHPIYGYDLLKSIEYLQPILDIPHYHHEKWDGSGYPSGLRGEEIPLAARIFAVVDVWDAMTSDRPYRKALPENEAIRYITEQSGKHFDPIIVQSFLNLISQSNQNSTVRADR